MTASPTLVASRIQNHSPRTPKTGKFKPPRGSPTQVIDGAPCQKLSPKILATFLVHCPAIAAARWMDGSRRSINALFFSLLPWGEACVLTGEWKSWGRSCVGVRLGAIPLSGRTSCSHALYGCHYIKCRQEFERRLRHKVWIRIISFKCSHFGIVCLDMGGKE